MKTLHFSPPLVASKPLFFNKKTNQGFTLIELLVTLSITAFLLTTLTSIFGVFILNSVKLNMEQKVKSEGNYALTQIQSFIRNATKINNCSSSSISLTDKDSVEVTIQKEADADGDQLIYTKAGEIYYLTSDYTQMPTGEKLNFTCTSDDLGLRYVDITFTLKRGTSDNPDRSTVIQQFNGGVAIRN